jgi:acetyltransferase
LVVLYCETAITNPPEIAEAIKRGVMDSGVNGKPITVSFVGGEKSDKAMQWLVECGIPAFPAPDLAVNAIASLHEYAQQRKEVAEEYDLCNGADTLAARETIAKAREDGRNALTEVESKKVFAAYGLPVTETYLATDEEDAIRLANKIGYPVVMKIVSPDILHKSDAGGVKVNIKDDASAREAFRTIMKNSKNYKADALIHGIAVQEMAPWGTEVILGSVNDPTFGPTIMFGLGGIFVEVLKDVTFRVAPVASHQAYKMLTEIRSAPILAGARGEAPRDREALADVLCKYSTMILDLEDEVSETDANPVLVYEEGKGVRVVDARVILKKKA